MESHPSRRTGNWEVRMHRGHRHVVPTDDRFDHQLCQSCLCGVRLAFDDDAMRIYTHREHLTMHV
ncbi:hypothetical protein SEA_PUPPER_189 [Gordonia phage Pupper]|uniref:Uncharacterized protein n=1 Tax=Gordonia phage Pupper TaxID=2571249 RepID=A0A4Y6EKV8_9CAUD|nr:hypothetical protein KHQ83_gp088 [Gordonia phage Pupper]QDF18675.1 hypothetical protein SEA_PUPPER_189 [Gordonia phage Pupper]QDF18907.1 hypothetical protein SEA_SCENTAE_188 [Gordonia phage SCentae]